MPFPAIADIPFVRDTFYVADVTEAPIDLIPTYSPYTSAAVGTEVLGDAPLGGDFDAGSLPTYDPAVEANDPFAEVDWTSPETGAAVLYDGRIDEFEVERTIPLNPFSNTRSTFGQGRLVLNNIDQALRDRILNNSIDGRNVAVAVGSKTDARSAFTTMFSGVADTWGSSTAQQVSIDLRDRWRQLINDPRPLFQGSGGIDGGEELIGKPMPLWLGYRSNVFCIPIAEVPFPILMCSYKHMDDITEVRVRGKAMTLDGTVTDIFSESTPAAGHCIVAPLDQTGAALIGLGSEPDGPVTATGTGLSVSGNYLSTHGDLAQWLLTELGGIDLAYIDTAAWDALSAAWPGEIGAWFGTDPIALIQMIDAVLSPLIWWGDDTDGMITCGWIDVPSSLDTPGGQLTEDQIIAVDRIDWPAGVPWKRVRVAYDVNNYIQTSDLAEATIDWLKYVKEPFRVHPQNVAPVLNAHIGAIDPDPIITPYKRVEEAGTVAQILAGLNNGSVDLWRVETSDDRIRYPLGHVLNLTYPSIADTAKPALVIGTAFTSQERRATYLLVA